MMDGAHPNGLSFIFALSVIYHVACMYNGWRYLRVAGVDSAWEQKNLEASPSWTGTVQGKCLYIAHAQRAVPHVQCTLYLSFLSLENAGCKKTSQPKTQNLRKQQLFLKSIKLSAFTMIL